jgi:orotidine-5'-phosphate decarboxylase
MKRKELVERIFNTNSYLCVGLDTDASKLPGHLMNDANGLFLFNKAIIDATKDYCIAYKINTAFYEALGIKGWQLLERTVEYIPSTHLKIADAKRGDIGNTSSYYAKAFFETLEFDALTVAPYMGEDSLRPFLDYSDKWTIVLGLTSNPGARDFELQKLYTSANSSVELKELALDIGTHSEQYLYEMVLRKVSGWGNTENLMFVVGATRSDEFLNIRNIIPNHFLLVPGVGAQGGSLKDISENAFTSDCGLLVNVSRSIIYASKGEDFSEKAAMVAQQYQLEMSAHLTHLKS